MDLIGISSLALCQLQLRYPLRMSQITFRLNTKPTYSERMTDARSELRKIIKDQLCKYPRSSSLHLPTPRSLPPTRPMLTLC